MPDNAFDGWWTRCARAACQKWIGAHGGGRHKDTGWRYCWPCARKINAACGQELIPYAEVPETTDEK